jgi:hypothetical protein
MAAMIVACQGPAPVDNGLANQPEAAEVANLSSALPANTTNEVVNKPEAPAPVAEQPKSCEAEIGKQAAAELVRRCLNVSPATHPPCNAANSCDMIQGEIDRSCAMFGDDKPSDCRTPEAQ